MTRHTTVCWITKQHTAALQPATSSQQGQDGLMECWDIGVKLSDTDSKCLLVSSVLHDLLRDPGTSSLRISQEFKCDWEEWSREEDFRVYIIFMSECSDMISWAGTMFIVSLSCIYETYDISPDYFKTQTENKMVQNEKTKSHSLRLNFCIWDSKSILLKHKSYIL